MKRVLLIVTGQLEERAGVHRGVAASLVIPPALGSGDGDGAGSEADDSFGPRL